MRYEKAKPYRKQEVQKLVWDTAEIDQIKPFIKISENINLHPEMTENTYVYSKNMLIGFLNILAPSDYVAEIFAIVHPHFRRQGIFTNLLDMAQGEISKFGIPKMLILCEGQSKDGATCLNHMGYVIDITEIKMKHDGTAFENPNLKDIEEVTTKDIKEYAKLSADIFETDLEGSINWTKKTLEQKNHTVLKLTEDGRIIGIGCYKNEDSGAVVYGIGIAQSHRGKGLSKLILRTILHDIQHRGITDISLEAEYGNEVTYNLYTSHGFYIDQHINYYTKA